MRAEIRPVVVLYPSAMLDRDFSGCAQGVFPVHSKCSPDRGFAYVNQDTQTEKVKKTSLRNGQQQFELQGDAIWVTRTASFERSPTN